MLTFDKNVALIYRGAASKAWAQLAPSIKASDIAFFTFKPLWIFHYFAPLRKNTLATVLNKI